MLTAPRVLYKWRLMMSRVAFWMYTPESQDCGASACQRSHSRSRFCVSKIMTQ